MKEKKAFQLYTVEEKLKIVQDHLNKWVFYYEINILGNDEMITKAILDRIIHHYYLFKITGPSYRLKDKLELSQSEKS